MNDRPIIPPISEATARVDALEQEENLRDFIGAMAVNTMLETMIKLHGRWRFEADDWRRAEMIRRVLMATPAADLRQESPNAAPTGTVPATDMLRSVERALQPQAAKQPDPAKAAPIEADPDANDPERARLQLVAGV